MENQKKIKIFLGISYLTIICVFLWLFFNTYSLNEITSYNFIRDNRNDLIEIKNSNFFLISILFIISTIIWVLLLGFGTPICLLAGFIFGKWIGTLFTVLGLSIGATLLYLISNFFF